MASKRRLQLRAASRRYYNKNKSKEKLRCSTYRKKNLKKYSNYMIKYRKAKKWEGYYKKYNKMYRITNNSILLKYDLNRYKGNRRIYCIVRNYNKKEGNKLMTIKLYKEILKKHNYKCHYCQTKKNIEMDHKVPISKGGKSIKINLVASCKSCNSKKGIKMYKKFTTR